MHIDELRNIEDYKNIFELKMETSPVFANSRSETRDLIIVQELRRLGYNVYI